MKKFCCLVLALFLLVIFPVSAENIAYFNSDDLPFSVTYEHKEALIDAITIQADTFKNAGKTSTGSLGIVLKSVESYPEINYVFLEHDYKGNDIAKYSYKSIPTGEFTGTYIRPLDNSNQTIRVYVDRYYNLLGQETGIRIIAFPQNWEIGSKTGTFHSPITFNGTTYSFGKYSTTYSYVFGSPVTLSTPLNGGIAFKAGSEAVIPYCVGHTGSALIGIVGYNHAKNTINIIDKDGLMEVSAVKQFDGKYYASEIGVYNKDNELITYDNKAADVVLGRFAPDILGKVTTKVSSLSGFDYALIYDSTVTDPTPDDPDDQDEAGLTVYIKNSQTGALIANANVAIDALIDGEYYTVTNRTEPSGIFTITLQPTGGGKPNPDGYRLIVTADGYNNPMPEINFTVDDYKLSIYCLLDPIAGGPVNENKTFIDFFVRDMSSNPISGATVKFGKYTLITNSAGYTVFEVDKNNNYSWTVSKSGYGALTGNAVIGNDPRHTIRTVLAPIVTPTRTTPIPTSPPIGPTPTMTAPTGEHVSNWLEWFAAHFGMILGGGVEIGKIFMWLCFTLPVGVYVGKEAKAGAAGFMAGAGIVTLFFVLIGWVPIWLVVLFALIIGLLYAKVFNTPDNGGGR